MIGVKMNMKKIFNLTHKFLKWLEKNHNYIYQSYIEDRENFEIICMNIDDIELIP